MNHQLEIVLNAMIEGVLVTNERCEIVLVNPACRAMLGLEEDCREKKLLECFRNKSFFDSIESVLKTGKAEELALTLVTGPEEKHFIIHTTPLPLGAVSVFNEITRLRQLENIRKEFVANVSHELKTPLTKIRGFAETLQSGAIADRQVALQFVGKIEKSAVQLQSLVEDILKLSELESGRFALHPTVIPLGETIRGLQEHFAEALQNKKLEFETVIPKDLQIIADRGALQQILTNLIENAIKYTPGPGTITVTAKQAQGQATITVADTGIGIPAGELLRIFERFYRVEPSRSRELGGTGLGLAIVKHLVQILGGTIEVKSQPGKGSEFSVTIK